MATLPQEVTSMDLLGSEDIRKLLHVGIHQARDIIKILNAELKAKGYLVVDRKVPATYVHKRYGLGVRF